MISPVRLPALILAVVSFVMPDPLRESRNGPEVIPCDSFGKLFVIAVGVNDAVTDGRGTHAARFAESDTKLIAGRLSNRLASRGQIDSLLVKDPTLAEKRVREASSALSNPADTASALQIAILTGESATFEEIRRAFERVIRKARAHDVFVFSFGGISRSVAGPVETEHYLSTGDVAKHRLAILTREGLAKFDEDRELREWGVSGKQLREWLDNIAAQKQLVMLEAGDMRLFFPEFVASIVENRPVVSQLTNRQRVVVAPWAWGLEFVDSSGTGGAGGLASVNSKANNSVLGLLFPCRRLPAEVEFRLKSPSGIADDGEYLRVFYERDFLELYSKVARGGVRSRGVDASADQKQVAAAPSGRHVALLVGTDSYDWKDVWPTLSNPVTDVRTIAGELASNFGFDTTVLVNPTTNAIFEKLLELKDTTRHKFGPQDELFILFAGHGLYDEGMGSGYLAARNSKPRSQDRFLKESYVSHAELADIVPGIPSRHILLVLDACFGGTFKDPLHSASGRSGDEYADVDRATFINRKLEHRSRVYLTSGGKVYVPDGRPGAHSPFARRFIDALRDASASNRVLTLSDLRHRVEGLQPEPKSGEFGDNEPGGDFLFIPSINRKLGQKSETQ